MCCDIFLMPKVTAHILQLWRRVICTVEGDTHESLYRPLKGGKAALPTMSCVFFSCFLAVLLELNNPGYSHYKSCCLDLRPQTGDRLCNLVSFSIPLGFTGRCLTLLAGYLLATLKATFLLTSQLGTHTYNVCTVDASARAHMHSGTDKNTCEDVPYLQQTKIDSVDA